MEIARRSCALADLERDGGGVFGDEAGMRARHRSQRRHAAARWREACVDGVLHAAYAAALRAETAAERCVPRGLRPQHQRRRRRRRAGRR
jgi:hypothetical protein